MGWTDTKVLTHLDVEIGLRQCRLSAPRPCVKDPSRRPSLLCRIVYSRCRCLVSCELFRCCVAAVIATAAAAGTIFVSAVRCLVAKSPPVPIPCRLHTQTGGPFD